MIDDTMYDNLAANIFVYALEEKFMLPYINNLRTLFERKNIEAANWSPTMVSKLNPSTCQEY